MIEILLKHGANYNALNKNLQTPIAFTTEKQKKDYFLDTCISHCLTYEKFCETVRGYKRNDGKDGAKKDSDKRDEYLSYR